QRSRLRQVESQSLGRRQRCAGYLRCVFFFKQKTAYEMTENMKLTSQGRFEHRKATSELIGTADAGTPLCPPGLIAAVNRGATSCTINATGSDNINLRTGLGDFSGTFTSVVQGDNLVDSPEFVVMRGSFK